MQHVPRRAARHDVLVEVLQPPRHVREVAVPEMLDAESLAAAYGHAALRRDHLDAVARRQQQQAVGEEEGADVRPRRELRLVGRRGDLAPVKLWHEDGGDCARHTVSDV